MEIYKWLKNETWTVQEALLLLAQFNPTRTQVTWDSPEPGKSIDLFHAQISNGILLDKPLGPSMEECHLQLQWYREGIIPFDGKNQRECTELWISYLEYNRVLDQIYREWLRRKDVKGVFKSDDLHPPKFFITWIIERRLTAKIEWLTNDILKDFNIANPNNSNHENKQIDRSTLIDKYRKIAIKYCEDHKKKTKQAPTKPEIMDYLEKHLKENKESLGVRKSSGIPEKVFRNIYSQIPEDLKRKIGATSKKNKQ